MTIKRKVAKITKAGAFILASTIGAAGMTYMLSKNDSPQYQAHLKFQIASISATVKPDMEAEKELLLSDALLGQVIEESHLVQPEDTKFRSFDLGPKIKNAGILPPKIDMFRNDFKVSVHPAMATMDIEYQADDSAQARRIVEIVFEKFKSWRRSSKEAGFDEKLMTADSELEKNREIFLQTQKLYLERLAQSTSGFDKERDKKLKLANEKIASLALRYGPKHPALVEAVKERDAIQAQEKPDPPSSDNLSILKQKMDKAFEELDISLRESVAVGQGRSAEVSPFKILPLGNIEVKTLPSLRSYKAYFTGLLGMLGAMIILFIRQKYLAVVESEKDIKKIIPFPFFGTVKNIFLREKEEISVPSGVTADALKTLRQEIRLRGKGAETKLVVVTSTWPNEGRSELIAQLGRMCARAGEHVLIMDADLRSPTLQTILPPSSNRNLVDYLSGQSRVEDIIHRTDPSGAHIIYGTAIPNTSLDLLSSEKMKTFLMSVREVYDLVLVQAPVSLRGPDARVLSQIADQTLYLVKSGETRAADLKAGISVYTESQIKSVGTVLVK